LNNNSFTALNGAEEGGEDDDEYKSLLGLAMHETTSRIVQHTSVETEQSRSGAVQWQARPQKAYYGTDPLSARACAVAQRSLPHWGGGTLPSSDLSGTVRMLGDKYKYRSCFL
jgi:hypothetical protein